jgi:hypothetical protein
MPRIASLAALTLVTSMVLLACTGAPSSSTPAAASDAASGTAPSPAASSAAITRINANTASESELAAAFAAAGISNAERWAREVTEYRPYPDDPGWAQLRQELGKYNIDPAVLEQIIAILEV